MSCNIRSLKENAIKLAKASLISSAAVICLQETWTEKQQSVLEFFDERFTHQHDNHVGKGKGIVEFYDESFSIEKEVKEPLYQVTKLTSETKTLINVYRSQGANTEHFICDLLEMINLNEHTLIVGDFNIYFQKNPTHPIF